MLVRQLVQAWLRQAAQEGLRGAVSDATRSGLPHALLSDQDSSGNAETLETRPCAAAFMFALGVESGGLQDRLQDVSRRRFKSRTEYDGTLQGRRVIAVDAGVGLAAAQRATERIIERYSPAWVVSAGFAGALREGLRRGQIVMADAAIDANGQELQIGLKMDTQASGGRGLHMGRLLTVDRIVRGAEEKRLLGERHNALACDMETFGVAQTCQRLKTRFLAIRVISDAVDDELPPELESLVNQKSSAARLGAAAGAIFRRPSSVKELWRLKEEAIKASDRLAKFLEGAFAQLT